MKTILTVIGTRPEAIKLAPVLSAISNSAYFTSKVCLTRQHTDLLEPFLRDIKMDEHYTFDNAKGKSLHQTTAFILERLGSVLEESKPDLVLVQGDTTTAFAASLASFYSHIPVAHVEAGLRTGNENSPWPEEIHRCLISRLARFSFAPTEFAKDTLISEGIAPSKIWVVGNTSADAIRLALKGSHHAKDTTPKNIIVTVHRRENQGKPLQNICKAIKLLAEQFPEINIQFLLHPNPNVYKPVSEMLSNVKNIHLLDPMDHFSFIQLLDNSLFIVTDSGGIQEEAPLMGKPVLVVRNTTERPEGIHAGTARLIGTDPTTILANCKELLENVDILKKMSKVHFPYGNGYAAEKIVNILKQEL